VINLGSDGEDAELGISSEGLCSPMGELELRGIVLVLNQERETTVGVLQGGATLMLSRVQSPQMAVEKMDVMGVHLRQPSRRGDGSAQKEGVVIT